MTIRAHELVTRLEGFAAVLPPLVACVTDADARWKPAAQHWSILEVCCHLLDEEREDFRPRLRDTLAGTADAWAPLNLEGIAERRAYNTRDPAGVVAEWVQERRASIAWLRSLDEFAKGLPSAASPNNPDPWSRAYQHPQWGAIRAGDLLASWAAHDSLHLRQIAKRLHGLAARDAGDFKIAYAGDWA